MKVRPIPAGDEIVAGRGDHDGWHLYAASSTSGGQWLPLATLDPVQVDPNGESWIGRQCLTGDGRYVVAVVAPWSANNSPAGMDRGGIAYVIDAHTGAVRPLTSGVSLYYFTPSCGPNDAVALTGFTGTDERTTRLVSADAASATLSSVQTVAGQFSSAVPAPDGGVIAVRGDAIVQVANGKETTRATVGGLPFNLVANAAGGADFLVGKGKNATVWTLDSRQARQVGTGRFTSLALFPGRAGHTIAAGTDHLDTTTGIKTLESTASAVEAVSLDGTLSAEEPATTAKPSTGAQDVRLPLTLRHFARDAGNRLHPAVAVTSTYVPDISAPATTSLPAFIDGTPSAPAPARAGSSASTDGHSATVPYVQVPPGGGGACAVPRNDVYDQAMQPSPQQVVWAANLAGRSMLTGQYARPAGFANMGLSSYSPSLDFPLAAPFGPHGDQVPREVLESVFAQESNFDQASWHSIQGVAGNPLIADYYGAAGGYVPGVAVPDCGYGIGQITSGMSYGTGALPAALQQKVAVDYAENVAAAAQILTQKWNELIAATIVGGDGNPNTLESWYFAIWDYNSGLHPVNGGNPWGLGWANNPANPDYPYNRETFLHQGTTINYGDAAHPGDWPYQEKVFGWMEVPQLSGLTGQDDYQGLLESYSPSQNANVLNTPPVTLTRPANAAFCYVAENQCDPTLCSRTTYPNACDPKTTDATGPCLRSDYECWWHASSDWCYQATCHSGSWESPIGGPEPPSTAGQRAPALVCQVSASDVPSGSLIVDSQATDVNLQGCDAANTNWTNSGTFGFTYGDPNNSKAQKTDMDVHQLGAGLGGHMWFTHTDEPVDGSGNPYWGATGTWTPSNLARGYYEVKVFVPDMGATATQAPYTVSGLGLNTRVTVNQNVTTGWTSLGSFWLGPGASVSLTNLGTTSGGDLAFSAVAFIPVSVPQPHLLLVHGYTDSCEGAFGRTGSYSWGTNPVDQTTQAKDTTTSEYLAAHGWPYGTFSTVGYYHLDYTSVYSDDGGDENYGNCDINLNDAGSGWQKDASGCATAWPAPANASYATLNDPIMHLACLFAWFISDTYSVRGIPVEIVAHSMGGLITRAAIGGTNAGAPGFPGFPLLVTNVVSVATPHGGVSGLVANASYWAGQGSQELSDMKAGSSFMTMLGGAAYEKPQGIRGTHWALIGSSVPTSDPATPTQSVACQSGHDITEAWSLARTLSCLQYGLSLDTYPDTDGAVEAISQMAMPADYKALYGAVEDFSKSKIYIADKSTEYQHDTGTCQPIPFGPPETCTHAPFYLNDGLDPAAGDGTTLTKAFVCSSACASASDFSDLALSSPPSTVPHSLAEIVSQLVTPQG